MEAERPLQLAGAINAYCAMLAERAGFRALYLSGAGVANASFGLPDLGLTTLTDVCEDVRRITGATRLPLLVDADTGWGPAAPMIAHAIRELERAGAAGCHLEDQAQAKRCGHRPGKQLVSAEEMSDRVKAAVDGRTDPDVRHRRPHRRACRRGCGSDPPTCAPIRRGRRRCHLSGSRDHTSTTTAGSPRIWTVPVLANITEFGVTPLFTVDELRDAGVRMVLYPLTAFRAMSAAARRVYEALRADGTQKSLLDSMQTRAELYEVLRYLDYERQFDELAAGKEPS